MKVLSTIAVCACFLLMLTATSKKRVPREAGSIPKLTIPSTTGWTRNEMAGIRFMSPPNSVITRGETLAEIRIQFANGPELTFAATAFDIAKNPQHDFHMFYTPDAQIVLYEMNSGDECQALACSSMPIMGSPLCLSAFSKTFDHCAQAVALVRSIQPL